MSAPRTAAALEEWLTAQVAALTGAPAGEIPLHRPLSELGLDSVDAVGLTGDLEDLLGRPVSPLLLWEHPDIRSLAAHLAAEAA